MILHCLEVEVSKKVFKTNVFLSCCCSARAPRRTLRRVSKSSRIWGKTFCKNSKNYVKSLQILLTSVLNTWRQGEFLNLRWFGQDFRPKLFPKFPKSFRKVAEKFPKRFRINQTSIWIPFGNAFQNPTKHQKMIEFLAFKTWKRPRFSQLRFYFALVPPRFRSERLSHAERAVFSHHTRSQTRATRGRTKKN